MNSEAEAPGQKRAEPLSTVSLDSTYDNDNEEPAIDKSCLRSRHSWTPFVILMGLILVAVGLVLALDRDTSRQVERDPILTAHSSLTSGQSLTAPKKKLVEWLKQMNNASELYVEGANSDMSLAGVVFPRHGTDKSPPFDAMITIDSGEVLPSRQYVALANGRGSKWVVTSLGYGDSIVTNACLTENDTLPFEEFNSIVKTANWSSSDREDISEVNIMFGGENYTVSKEDSDYTSSRCWLVESEDEVFGLHVCIPELIQQFPKVDFEELFNATSGCPQFAVTRTKLLIPLPLRKWYASYKG